MVNQNYVLLDNQRTVDQIINPSLLANIRKVKNPITVHCNNKLLYTNIEGDLGWMTMYLCIIETSILGLLLVVLLRLLHSLVNFLLSSRPFTTII